MQHRHTLLVAAVVVCAATSGVTAAYSNTRHRRTDSGAERTLSSRHVWKGCPHDATIIPRGNVAAAGRAALYYTTHLPPHLFVGGAKAAKRLDRANKGGRVVSVLAPHHGWENKAVRVLCGEGMVSRTLVVFVHIPLTKVGGSASMSQWTLFVMRTRRGSYRVWYQFHP